VIVTAPVAMHLRDGDLNPWAYDVCKDRVNPMRALVFAAETPTSVTVQVGSGTPTGMTHVSGPVWTAVVDTSAVAAGQQTVTVTAVAASKTRADAVTANFVAGPCTPYQDDGGLPQQDGGGGGHDGGTPGDDGGEPAQEDGGSGADAGTDQPADGCGCRLGGVPGAGWLGLLAVAGLTLVGRRRGRRGR
jgi:MYXO-CTERM domain-containing protein